MKPTLHSLCQRIGYQFTDNDLLAEALTHRSIGSRNYERLEFLGDSALDLVISHELYNREPSLDEGALSRLRASLVKGATLCEIARELDLGQYLRLGTGELKSGGFERDSILADAVESVIGAVYLEAGFDVCRELILRLFASRLDNLPSVADLKDPKTRLQEKLQGSGLALPVYELLETSGKSHQQIFTVSCQIPSLGISATAQASSRRKAEQLTAKSLLNNAQILDLKAS